jgi:multimeric flavodoxin WrbA
MKAVALVASARKGGNGFDFGSHILERMHSNGWETELVEFYDYDIQPCHHCAYECLQRHDPVQKQDSPCPIQDDVRALWEKTWQADALILIVPNYGGLPPALWTSFSQRSQAFFNQAPLEKLRKSVVSALVIASPQYSSGAQWTPSIMADEVKWLDDRRVAAFEVINNSAYATEGLFGHLIEEPAIQTRLNDFCEQTVRLYQATNDLIAS